MLISFEKEFVYTKTRKTGSTSVEVHFQKACVPPGYEITHGSGIVETRYGIVGFRGVASELPEGAKWRNHMSATRIRSQLGRERWDRYFKFCCIRNPFDKMVSLYYFQTQKGQTKPLQDKSFPEIRAGFLTWIKGKEVPYDGNKYLIDGKVVVDDFIRYERLSEDVGRVSEKLGIAFAPGDLPTLKTGYRSARQHFSEYFDRDAADLVRARYSFENDYFGYGLKD